MVFQDFDHLSERRRAERQQKMRKRNMIGVISSLAIAGVIAGAVIGVVSYYSQGDSAASPKATAAAAKGTTQLSHSEKSIKMMCQSTDFQDTCTKTLEKAVEKDPSMSQPKDLLKLAVQAAYDEVEAAFEKAKSFKFETPREKAAFEDCKVLMEDALEELNASVSGVGEISKLSKKTPELNNWLSAVMSYQETCIDGVGYLLVMECLILC